MDDCAAMARAAIDAAAKSGLGEWREHADCHRLLLQQVVTADAVVLIVAAVVVYENAGSWMGELVILGKSMPGCAVRAKTCGAAKELATQAAVDWMDGCADRLRTTQCDQCGSTHEHRGAGR